MISRSRAVVVLALLCFGVTALAQNAVPVGKGSYADAVPATLKNKAGKIESQPLYLVGEPDRAIPSNKWWTQLVVSKFAKSLWTFPQKVETSEGGVDVYFPTRWSDNGSDPVSEFPFRVGGEGFKPADARAKDWSDWLVSFRMGESANKFIDVTLGQGMPATWFEFTGVKPFISYAKPNDKNTARFFDLSGKTVTLPLTADCVGVEFAGRTFGLFAPDGTRFDQGVGRIDVTLGGKGQYLVLCPLPSPGDIALFHRHAYAIPRDTKMNWSYDRALGQVKTTWDVTTEPLKGTEKRVIQGWIPHHYRKTQHALKFENLQYLSPRGPLKCTIGNRFEISYAFNGLTPTLPAPTKQALPNAYDPERMNWYLSQLIADPKFGADTYWGGKDILRFGHAALMSQQVGNADQRKFVSSLRDAMADWFTYSPGEKDHFFVHYPKWRALVGINPSYGSEGFNDHHFHYGYFTFASALLAMHDPTFVTDYGEMAALVAKEYANWDRTDNRFPFLRTFDIWAGHSWAGGTSGGGGNNQESSSEAVQSWAGLIYLGQALGNDDMLAAGVMGYAIESRATMEYWFNEGGDVFPPQWKHPVTGMVWSGGKVYGTYFTGDPAWIYAIQWLPASPMLSYLVQDPAFARKMFDHMTTDFNAHEIKESAKKQKDNKPRPARTASIKTFGPALGSVMLGYVLMYDPDWAAQQLDDLWNEKDDKIAHAAKEMTVMYYQTHSMRTIGRVDWTCRTSSPTSMVYLNDKTKSRTYVVWNPRNTAETVTVYENNKRIGTLIAKPQALTSTASLKP